MGAVTEMLGVSPTFPRALGAAKLIEPNRSGGGHRRYSRYQLRLPESGGHLSAHSERFVRGDGHGAFWLDRRGAELLFQVLTERGRSRQRLLGRKAAGGVESTIG